jgi:hypothetical protein
MFIALVFVFTIVHTAQPLPAWGSDKISKTEPQILGTPEEDLSTLGTTGKKSKTGMWLGIIAAVGLVAALAAGGGGGGGGGDSATQTPADSGSGSVSVGW